MEPRSPRHALILSYSCSQNTAGLAAEASATLENRGWQCTCSPLNAAVDQFATPPDLLVVGVPVHYWTIPVAARNILRQLPALDGCAAFVFSTYGGCVTRDVPSELAAELTSRGATVLGAAQMLMPHSVRGADTRRLGEVEEYFGKGHPRKDELTDFRRAIDKTAARVEKGILRPVPAERLKINTMGIMARLMDTVVSLDRKKQSMPPLEVHTELCTGCGRCVRACDAGALVMDDRHKVRHDARQCEVCHACLEVCPSGALSLDGQKMEHLVRMMHHLTSNTDSKVVI